MKSILRKIQILLSRILALVTKEKILFLTFFILLLIFFSNSLDISYPDEFESILGGYYIDHGVLPYIGFFAHHVPFAYFFASVLTIFSGVSFVKFRILLAIAYFGVGLGNYLYFNRRFGKKIANLFLGYLFVVSITATYVWGQMLVADSLVGYLLTPVFLFLILVTLKKESFRTTDIIYISVLTCTSLLTSVTYIYVIGLIYLYTFFYFIDNYRVNQKPFILRKFALTTVKYLLILICPYLIFALYLIITGSLGDFYYQAIYFTSEYYVGGDGGVPTKNPIRFALSIFYRVFDQYRASLVLSKDLNFSFPFSPALVLSNFLLSLYLFIKKKKILAFFIFFSAIYLNGRSNPLTTTETDYQGIPYQYFSLLCGIFLLTQLWDELKENIDLYKRTIFSVMSLLLGVYYIFLSLFLFGKYFEKVYLKYMGTRPLIYDRPAIATTIDQIVKPGEYYYAGPFDFEDILYTKAKIATRYIVTIPAMDKADKIQKDFLNDIKKRQPILIVFNTEQRIFGDLPGSFFLKYIHENYFDLEEMKSKYPGYKTNEKWLGNYDFERHFFFPRLREVEMMNRLRALNLINY